MKFWKALKTIQVREILSKSQEHVEEGKHSRRQERRKSAIFTPGHWAMHMTLCVGRIATRTCDLWSTNHAPSAHVRRERCLYKVFFAHINIHSKFGSSKGKSHTSSNCF